MASVDAAEKEASEVLHTLLAVERIEKQEDNGENQSTTTTTFQTATVTTGDVEEGEAQIQWHTPVPISHSLFSTIDGSSHFTHNIDEQQVIWEGHAIVDPDNNISTIYTGNVENSEPSDDSTKFVVAENKTTNKTPAKPKKVVVKKRKKTEATIPNDPTKLEESAAQVKERFKRGCECQDESCFRGLNPESVYKHRLNIAELTKGEHDMYLMGVTMACLANPETTVRHRERRRLRAQYVYQGRRVCLDAFLYLENCTHYQLKRIRKHVMTHGVAPRVHGNHGESPNACEEFEMQNSVTSEQLGVNDVLELLQQEYAIISGGKSKEGCPIITFPDKSNFEMLSDTEYQRLMLYLTSVPSLHDADLGFHLIIDRRNDKWNSVKAVLLKISVYFPGLVHVVYVLRPASFIQKALSEVSNKLFKDEFKFRMIVLSTTEELHKYISVQQLTPDLGGTLPYNHEDWIQQRIELETFSAIAQQISNSLDDFTKSIEEGELPNDVDSTQQLLDKHTLIYSDLKKEILSVAKHGEDLLSSIKEKKLATYGDESQFPDPSGNIFAVERLLVQLEGTEQAFDDFWQFHSSKLRHCLDLRRFEQDFRELQVKFESHLKTISDAVESGETVENIDQLIKQTKVFEKLCTADIDRADEVISSGQHLVNINSCPRECVEPKCTELIRVRNLLLERLTKRIEALTATRTLLEHIDNANQWCTTGVELLASQQIEQCSNSSELAERYVLEIREFIASSKDFTCNGPGDFKSLFEDISSPETKALVTQVLQRIEDVTLMCNKRINSLIKLAVKPKKPVQAVIPEPAVPRQPQIGAPVTISNRVILKKAYTIPKISSPDGDPITKEENVSPEDEINKIKIGHVLTELLETEKVYVRELSSIINGYKVEAQHASMQHILPFDLDHKMNVIFGNLEEIHTFHSEVFLKDLENCISSLGLVALCFLQKKDTFYKLYSFYCQNVTKSEEMRESAVELHSFFQSCQQKLGHKLPLAAYLLKPVQRITKYQLLLKDLHRYASESKCGRELQQALDCMLVVLKCVNDSMHQISITGFPMSLEQQGELLLQGSLSVWMESKRDLRLRLKPMQRHLFLYKKILVFCKPNVKAAHNKDTYQYKHHLKMSQIGLTESVKGDPRKFEVWLQGRQEVHTIQAPNIEQKNTWVNEIKKVLFNQLEEIKGEKIKQYALSHNNHSSRPLRQTTSWEKQKQQVPVAPIIDRHRALSCDTQHTHSTEAETLDYQGTQNWSSDDDDDDDHHTSMPSGHYVALADYCAVGNSEVNMKEGDIVELLKVGCAGWWFVKMIGSSVEGWAPASYLENFQYKTSRSNSSRSQDRFNE